MPSVDHEILVELLRSQPRLLPMLLTRALGTPVPGHQAVRVAEAQLPHVVPTAQQADLVLHLTDGSGAPVLALVVEVQLHDDPEKRYAWPWYAAVHVRSRCRTYLVVVTPDAAVARWAKSINDSFQPNSPFQPLIVGPSAVPRITDPEEARERPYLAVLSAMTHGGDPDGDAIARAAHRALEVLDREEATQYAEFIWRALGRLVRRSMEEIMRKLEIHEYQHPWIRRGIEKGLQQGRAEGMVQALVGLLAARGLAVSDAERERIEGCNDIDTLSRWIARAATADRTAEVLDVRGLEGPEP